MNEVSIDCEIIKAIRQHLYYEWLDSFDDVTVMTPWIEWIKELQKLERICDED